MATDYIDGIKMKRVLLIITLFLDLGGVLLTYGWDRSCIDFHQRTIICDRLLEHGNAFTFDASIVDGSGNGITVEAQSGGATVKNFVVKNVARNGMVITGDNCIIQGGIIDGAGGVGLLVKGNRNAIGNVMISNCMRPIVIEGEGNIVHWDTNKMQPPAGSTKAASVKANSSSNLQNVNASGALMSVSGKINPNK